MKQKLLNVEKNYKTKYLKFYTAHYETDGKKRDYYFVSRNDERDLAIRNKKIKPTAIEAFTYYQDANGTMYAVMIEEFRSPIGQYVLSFPAGLIEKKEDIYKAITREVKEEVGGEVEHIKLLQNYPMALCAGMTDEANYFALVKLSNIDKQQLEETEDIKVKIYEVNQLHKMVQNNELNLSASGYLGYLVLYTEMI